MNETNPFFSRIQLEDLPFRACLPNSSMQYSSFTRLSVLKLVHPHKLGDPLKASRTVSHVSSRWRDVALNNPSLCNRSRYHINSLVEETRTLRTDEVRDKKDAKRALDTADLGQGWVGQRMRPEHGVGPHLFTTSRRGFRFAAGFQLLSY